MDMNWDWNKSVNVDVSTGMDVKGYVKIEVVVNVEEVVNVDMDVVGRERNVAMDEVSDVDVVIVVVDSDGSELQFSFSVFNPRQEFDFKHALVLLFCN